MLPLLVLAIHLSVNIFYTDFRMKLDFARKLLSKGELGVKKYRKLSTALNRNFSLIFISP